MSSSSGAPKVNGVLPDGMVVRRETAEVEDEATEIDEDEEDVTETLAERLIGLTEMVPDRVWRMSARTLSFSYWFVRRSAWVLGTSVALLVLPGFIEQQRLEFEEMQNMQKKQLMLGQGAVTSNQPIAVPPVGSGQRPA